MITAGVYEELLDFLNCYLHVQMFPQLVSFSAYTVFKHLAAIGHEPNI